MSLDDFSRRVKKVIEQTSQAFQMRPHKEEYKKKIEKLRDEIKEGLLDVDLVLSRYEELVDEYYQKYRPFGSNNHKTDIEHYIELIGHSAVIGSPKLLQKWGIDYPIENPNVLARPLSEYPDNFEKIIINNWSSVANKYEWTPDVEIYWEYLIRKLEKASS